jgi:hypothetical protein
MKVSKQLSNYQIISTATNILPLKPQLKVSLEVHVNKTKNDQPHPQVSNRE